MFSGPGWYVIVRAFISTYDTCRCSTFGRYFVTCKPVSLKEKRARNCSEYFTRWQTQYCYREFLLARWNKVNIIVWDVYKLKTLWTERGRVGERHICWCMLSADEIYLLKRACHKASPPCAPPLLIMHPWPHILVRKWLKSLCDSTIKASVRNQALLPEFIPIGTGTEEVIWQNMLSELCCRPMHLTVVQLSVRQHVD